MTNEKRWWVLRGVVVSVLVGGCYSTVRPPVPGTVSEYCQESAEEAQARALRGNAYALGAAVVSAGALLGAPHLAAQVGERDGALAASAMTGLAVASALAAHRWRHGARHEAAIASGFAGCIGAPPERAFATARAVYQLWLRPELSRSELLRERLRELERQPIVPWGPGPDGPPPDDASDLGSDNDIIEAMVRRR